MSRTTDDIDHLRELLDEAQDALIGIGARRLFGATAGIFDLLHFRPDGVTDEAWAATTPHQRERARLDAILAKAAVTGERYGWNRERALCPLCGDRPDMEDRGYTVPIGLERHLTGWGGRHTPCPVMRALDAQERRR